MATVFDIAAHIKSRLGTTTGRMKMHKLAYYVQAWSLVWRDRPAFADEIQAWKDGPVVKSLWIDQNHQDSAALAKAQPLSAELVAHVDRVLVYYGHMSADELSRLTHKEDPWLTARGATPDGAVSEAAIPDDHLLKYYGHRWVEAERDNASAAADPAFAGSIDELEALITAG